MKGDSKYWYIVEPELSFIDGYANALIHRDRLGIKLLNLSKELRDAVRSNSIQAPKVANQLHALLLGMDDFCVICKIDLIKDKLERFY